MADDSESSRSDLLSPATSCRVSNVLARCVVVVGGEHDDGERQNRMCQGKHLMSEVPTQIVPIAISRALPRCSEGIAAS